MILFNKRPGFDVLTYKIWCSLDSFILCARPLIFKKCLVQAQIKQLLSSILLKIYDTNLQTKKGEVFPSPFINFSNKRYFFYFLCVALMV